MRKPRLIDLTYYANTEFRSIAEAAEAQKEALAYTHFLKDRLNIEVIKHLSAVQAEMRDGIPYRSFRGKNRFFHIPSATHRYLKKLKPDVVLVQGLIFPVQVIFLRLALGRKSWIIVQHHGEQPFKGVKGLFQKWADRYIDAYAFTSCGNAESWIKAGIISAKAKCHELLEASSFMAKQDRVESRAKLNISGDYNFLWVGHLKENKDPLTVLSGFEKYLSVNPQTRLYMIYQSAHLLPQIKEKLEANALLKNAVHLIGKVEHGELACWYSAADFYISGSRREGSGYALLESMACGCVPIVTDIPSFRTITGNGRFGFLYQAGNADDLFEKLLLLEDIEREKLSTGIIRHFETELSFKSIADKLYSIIGSLPK
jgi:glycosyltransferase involved in cell wall biosynthesis